MSPKNVPNHVKQDVWLMQRLQEPEGYVNPFGDVNCEIRMSADHDDTISVTRNNTEVKPIADVISPDYMGAAEYEWGVYQTCLDAMYKWGVFNTMAYIYPSEDKPKFRTNHIPVNIVHCNGAEIADIVEQVRYLYLEVSRVYHETGTFPEISKNDHGSFYRTLQDRQDPKYIGWLNVKQFYGIFPNGDHAEDFINHVNGMHKQVAYNLDKETV